MRKLISIVAGLVMAVAASVVSAPQASAATVCNGANFFNTSWGVYRAEPTYNGSRACTLRYGNRGAGVTYLQFILNYCYGARIAQDGSFGPATWQALANAQRRAGITADGIYGPVSHRYLRQPTRYTVVPVTTTANYNGCSSAVVQA